MSDLDQTTLKNEISLNAQIEALLFVAPGAVNIGQLATTLGVTNRVVESALEELEQNYQNRGIRLQRFGGRVQLTSAPEAAEAIETFLGLEATSRLSSAALEALAIIAYQQPVTRPQVDAIRGVNSDGVMKNLLHKGLIQEVGRAEGPGRPILYSTTPEFLGHFGLASLEELPPLNLEELNAPIVEDEESSTNLLKD
ncbi:MAG TPA: SMC-Scp complex subunit ScpB [Chloroflexi bacterium]|nr:SMC-Scp complex subunit ScpB [Chloroflexota bacterium]